MDFFGEVRRQRVNRGLINGHGIRGQGRHPDRQRQSQYQVQLCLENRRLEMFSVANPNPYN